MKKYYVGLMVLMIGTIGLLVITLGQAKTAKQDKETLDKAYSTSSKLDDYISQKRTIPTSLADANIKNVPSTVTYEKISSTEYKFCATFSRASDGYDAGWGSLFTGALYGSQDTSSNDTFGDSGTQEYFQAYKLYSHKKGENCQTVKPYIFNNSYCQDFSSSSNYGCLNNNSSSSDSSTINL
ncbi:hypothetical protein COU91_00665 [Candidatus Saccharibacteria bacterium CG10_big_fil_rev_8_21_14_0_10_47_8]|nr:MAG: hypothetical protein COU91_00665 [Candidatus Saccharibacteria bacterium CG10_big_fil_rev_8_21_14_0_10_47_8]